MAAEASVQVPPRLCLKYALSFGFELKKQNRLALIKGDKKDAIRKGGILVICRILENRYSVPAGASDTH